MFLWDYISCHCIALHLHGAQESNLGSRLYNTKGTLHKCRSMCGFQYARKQQNPTNWKHNRRGPSLTFTQASNCLNLHFHFNILLTVTIVLVIQKYNAIWDRGPIVMMRYKIRCRKLATERFGCICLIVTSSYQSYNCISLLHYYYQLDP